MSLKQFKKVTPEAYRCVDQKTHVTHYVEITNKTCEVVKKTLSDWFKCQHVTECDNEDCNI